MNECEHIVGLKNINDNEDEFVIVEQGDYNDTKGYTSVVFDYCPTCGEFLNKVTKHILGI